MKPADQTINRMFVVNKERRQARLVADNTTAKANRAARAKIKGGDKEIAAYLARVEPSR